MSSEKEEKLAVPEYMNLYLINLQKNLEEIGLQLAHENYYHVMNLLWKLIPTLSKGIREKYLPLLQKIPSWRTVLHGQQGLTPADKMRSQRSFLGAIATEIETAYTDVYMDLIDSGLFEFQRFSLTPVAGDKKSGESEHAGYDRVLSSEVY